MTPAILDEKLSALQSCANMAQALALQLELAGEEVNADHVMMIKADLEFEMQDLCHTHGPIVERKNGKAQKMSSKGVR